MAYPKDDFGFNSQEAVDARAEEAYADAHSRDHAEVWGTNQTHIDDLVDMFRAMREERIERNRNRSWLGKLWAWIKGEYD